jgi:hypothetical protein
MNEDPFEEETKRMKELLAKIEIILKQENARIISCSLSFLLIKLAIENEIDKKLFLSLMEKHWDHVNENINSA